MKARGLSAVMARGRRARPHQQGMILILTLVALVLLMLAATAIFRSTDAASWIAAQVGFRRDLKNEGERGLARALTTLDSGSLATRSGRYNHVSSENYSATLLSSNDQGLPSVLTLNDEDFAAAGMQAAAIKDAQTGASVRTVIDRMCTKTGAENSTECTQMLVDCSSAGGQDQNRMQSGTSAITKCIATAYRISVRVDGPRSTQAYFQSVVAR